MVSVTLVNCDPEGISLLFDVLKNVNDILGDAGLPSTKMTEIKAVKSVLSKALERHGQSVDDTGILEPQNPSEQGRGGRDSEHVDENPSEGEWEFYRLCKWILNQIQASDLEENGRCREVIDTLEARCRLTDPKTEKCASTQAQQEDTPQGEAIEDAHSQSPISHLPVEILQHIFRLAALPHLWIQAPLVLSFVNSHFRTIVLDTPSLWTAVDNTLPLPILQLYIARSRNEPLDVLTKTDFSWSNDDLLGSLNVESTRIKHVAVVGSHADSLSAWGMEIDRDERFMFTSLTTLTLRVIDGSHDRVLCPTWANFPNLRELWIEGCWCRGWVGPDDPFPPTLQRLRLSKVSPVCLVVLLNALDGALGLIGLVMEEFVLDPDELFVPETRSRVTLDVLEELEFVNFSIADMNIISRYVSNPNLSTLSITSSGPSDGIADFLLPFSYHHPQLSSLSILGFTLELGGLKQALNNLVNLTCLRIHAFYLTGDDLALLKEGTLSSLLTPVVVS